jgi:hypothetical protein
VTLPFSGGDVSCIDDCVAKLLAAQLSNQLNGVFTLRACAHPWINIAHSGRENSFASDRLCSLTGH